MLFGYTTMLTNNVKEVNKKLDYKVHNKINILLNE